MEIILLIARLILAAVFGVAGISKLFDIKGSQKAVADFGMPEKPARLLGIILPIAEIVTAILLLPLSTAWLGAVLSLVLLLAFIGGIAYNMAQGNAPDCHCFGQIHSEPVGWSTLIRNLILALFAVFIVVFGRESSGISAFAWLSDLNTSEIMNLVLGIIIVGILGFIAVTLRQILKQQFVLQRQIEVLELTSGEGDRKVEREDTTLPADGLPIGSFAPAFSLADSQGGQVTIDKLLEKRKPLILFFASPNCNPCAALLPEIEKWKTEFGEKLDFVFVSSGTAAENSEKFGAGKTILLQKSRETMELYQAKWTPSAVLINADGTIGSRLATGGDNIRELVETIKPDLPSPGSNGHAPKKLFFARNNSRIGKPAPDFALPDLEGKRVNLQNLRGGKTLLLFWGTNCSFCQRMLDDLRNWENQPENKRKADLIVVSGGEAQINREQNFKSPVLLQEKTETMQLFGATGTPSAVIIDEEGNIASEIAVGADEVFALVGYSPKKD